MLYQIATLIHFYKITMERTIGVDALMSTVLTEWVSFSSVRKERSWTGFDV